MWFKQGCKATSLKSHFGMDDLLRIWCIFWEYLFLRRVFLKKVFWKYAADLQENTHEVWVALQLYWNHTSPWVFSCKFVVYLIWRRQMNGWFSRRLSFDGFLGLKIFEIFQILTKYARLEGIHPIFPYLKHLQSSTIDLLPSSSHLEIR